MGKRITRRSLIKFVGGSAAGLALTPVPWKLLDDVSIWTQNWGWIPKPHRGPVTTRFSSCSLCPAGCALRARCVGGQPVRLSGVAGLPFGRSTLCPVGLGAHHLPHHPARLRHPIQLNPDINGSLRTDISLDSALSRIAAALAADRPGSVAVLDARPGRCVSALYRRFLAGIPRGLYITAGSAGFTSQLCLDEMLDRPCGPVGLDLARSRTILSIGAPLINGWGSPDTLLRHRPELTLIQVESRRSETAALANRWLPLRPGTEVAFLLGIAHVLIRDSLLDQAEIRRRARDFDDGRGRSYRQLVNEFDPTTVAEVTGLSESQIVETARTLHRNAPAVVIGGADPVAGPIGAEEEVAIFGLNLLLGAVGRPGGLWFRREVPQALSVAGLPDPIDLGGVPDRSVRVLILDGAQSGWVVPWPMIRKKLIREDALVVSLSPFLAGLTRQADVVVPGPVFSEVLDEILPHDGAAFASFGLSSPMVKPPDGVTEPSTFIRKLARAAGVSLGGDVEGQETETLLKNRVNAIYESGRGEVFQAGSAEARPLSGIESGEALWQQLLAGGRWIDREPESRPAPRFSLLGRSAEWHPALLSLAGGRRRSEDPPDDSYPLTLMPFGPHGLAASGQMSPIVTKLYQESDLMPPSGCCLVHPETARQHRLADRGRAVFETRWGSAILEIRIDAMTMPGVLLAAVGPDPAGFGRPDAEADEDILSVCVPDHGRVWRVTGARVQEV